MKRCTLFGNLSTETMLLGKEKVNTEGLFGILKKEKRKLTLEAFDDFYISNEGLLDVFKSIGKFFGLISEDIKDDLDDLNSYIEKNKITQVNDPEVGEVFARTGQRPLYGLLFNLYGVKGLTKELNEFLKDIKSLVAVQKLDEILKLATNGRCDDNPEIYKKIITSFPKNKLMFTIYSAVRKNFWEENGTQRIMVGLTDLVCFKNNSEYWLEAILNNGDAAMSMVIGKITFDFEKLATYKETFQQESFDKVKFDFKLVQDIIKMVSDHRNGYLDFSKNLKADIKHVEQLSSKYKNADNNYVNVVSKFTKAVTTAYKERLKFYYAILETLIKACKTAVKK